MAPAIALVLVLGAALLRHFAALKAPFFADDYLFLEQVRGRTLFEALFSPDPIGNFLRPVSRPLYFWVLTRLGGESSGFFHAVNLGLFLVAVLLLFGMARRLAGPQAAIVAAAILALHYAADVPVQWSSGSQDLLALVGALGTISLYLAGHRLSAAVVCALALLSKESVCLVPVVAMLLDPERGTNLRARFIKAWPLFAVTAAWAVLWLGTSRLRPAAATVMDANPKVLPAALAHLAQVSLGLEVRTGSAGTFSVEPLLLPLMMLLAATAVVWAAHSARPSHRGRVAGGAAAKVAVPGLDTRGAVGAGLAWSICGALPIAAVASIWSAYFYIFALCGVALAVGAWVSSRPRWLALVVVGLLTLSSERARQIDEFATGRGAWTAQSHVTRFYVDRAMRRVSRYLAELKRRRPTLPSRSTIFYANVPPSSGWQAGDGALLRWAYRDTTLRSYYLTNFSLQRARRGPVFFFVVENDALRDHTDDPELLRNIAYSMIVNRKPGPAVDALTLELERQPNDRQGRYWLAWAQWANGDTAGARRSLVSCGVAAAPGPSPELARAAQAISARDTVSAVQALIEGRNRHCLDPEIHSRLAALLLPRESQRPSAVVEAFAVTALAPQRADGWRKLAAGQLYERQYGPAAESLRRYFRLGGQAAKHDAEAQQVMASLMRVLPGGDVAQTSVRD